VLDIEATARQVAELKAAHDVVVLSYQLGAEGDAAAKLPPGPESFLSESRGDARGFARRMAQADVLVFPTLSDGFGLVQLEAMAQGLPVIATSACGEVVRDGWDGFVVPPGDVESLVEALRRLRREPDLYAAMSQAALGRATEFGPERHLAGLLASP